MTLVAGVDSSTQGCKIVIADLATGKTVRMGRASHPEGSEVDPEAWWTALQDSIAAAGGVRDISAIAVSGQQHGLVALDKGGNVVRKALLWNDTRSAPSAADLITEIGGPEVYAQRVGIVPVASFTASKLRWLRDAEPENAKKVAAVALPHDWLTWRLMGYGPENPDLEKLVTDRSDASGTAYWSGETGDYDEQLFKHALGRPLRVATGTSESANADPDAVIVPRVLEPYMKAGVVSHAVLDVDSEVVVGPGTGDNAGGALGLGVAVGDVVVSLGTSGAVFSPIDGSLGAGDPSGVVAGFSSAAGGHLPLICTLNGARILEAAAKLIRVPEGPAGLTPFVDAAAPGAGGLVLLPYFEGERTPNLPEAKASLHNMTLANTTPENIARAAVEALVCSMAQAINALQSFGTSHTQHKRVLLIGGASVNPAVQKIATTVFNVDTVVVPVQTEYVARGAALQSGWALTGRKPQWSLPVARELSCHFEPRVLEQYEKVLVSLHPELKNTALTQ